MWLRKPELTAEQRAAIDKIQSGNPGLMPITYGFFSDGSVSLTLIWSFEPKAIYKQTIDKMGEFVEGSGIGPYWVA